MRTYLNQQTVHSQKMAITPQTLETMAILQAAIADLRDFVAREMEQNPLLEAVEASSPGSTESGAWREALPHIGRPAEPAASAQGTVSLQDHVLAQVRLSTDDQRLLAAAEILTERLDDNGYLDAPLETIARDTRLPMPLAQEALALVQSVDPSGIGARTLSECLLLQLRNMDQAGGLATKIIARHLEDLAAGNMERIAGLCRAPMEKVLEAADVIRSLDPKPGRLVPRSSVVTYVIPDVIVSRVDGTDYSDFSITVNDAPACALRMSAYYLALIERPELDPSAREFIEQRIKRARWLIRSIEQRRITLFRVMEAVVSAQREFFHTGRKRLQPLRLSDVADKVRLHVSTISRAVSGKCVQTPHGIVQMRWFFSSGVQSSTGALSSHAIKQLIKELVVQEDKSRPLSDGAMVEILKHRGVDISRRTVAKYRAAEGIRTASERRRTSRIAGVRQPAR